MTPTTQHTPKVPKLRFPGFVGEWEEKKLGNISDVTKLAGYEFTKHIVYEEEGKIIALRGLNIKNNSLILDDVKYIDKSNFAKLSRSKLYINDLMFTYVGTIGETALIEEDDRFYLAPNVARIRMNQAEVFPVFINHFFKNSKFQSKEILKYVATSSQPALSMENIRKFKIFLPQLPEQQKIAIFLSVVDEKINSLEKKKNSLQEYKKGMMQKIFSQEVRFKSDDGESFGDWEEKRLGEVCEINKGTQLNGSELTEIGLYPAINGGIKESGFTHLFNREKNKITISEGGNSCGYINFIKTNFWCGGHCYSIDNIQSDCSTTYLFQFLHYNQINIMRLRVGSGLPNIQKKDIAKFKVILPLLPEQQKISDFLNGLDEKIESVESEIKSAKEWKKGLLQGMFV